MKSERTPLSEWSYISIWRGSSSRVYKDSGESFGGCSTEFEKPKEAVSCLSHHTSPASAPVAPFLLRFRWCSPPRCAPGRCQVLFDGSPGSPVDRVLEPHAPKESSLERDSEHILPHTSTIQRAGSEALSGLMGSLATARLPLRRVASRRVTSLASLRRGSDGGCLLRKNPVDTKVDANTAS